MSNQNPYWLNHDGTPITNRLPTQTFVYGPPMNGQQQAEVWQNYRAFCLGKTCAVGDYFVRNRILSDGSTVRMVSFMGQDTILVWTRGLGQEWTLPMGFMFKPGYLGTVAHVDLDISKPRRAAGEGVVVETTGFDNLHAGDYATWVGEVDGRGVHISCGNCVQEGFIGVFLGGRIVATVFDEGWPELAWIFKNRIYVLVYTPNARLSLYGVKTPANRFFDSTKFAAPAGPSELELIVANIGASSGFGVEEPCVAASADGSKVSWIETKLDYSTIQIATATLTYDENGFSYQKAVAANPYPPVNIREKYVVKMPDVFAADSATVLQTGIGTSGEPEDWTIGFACTHPGCETSRVIHRSDTETLSSISFSDRDSMQVAIKTMIANVMTQAKSEAKSPHLYFSNGRVLVYSSAYLTPPVTYIEVAFTTNPRPVDYDGPWPVFIAAHGVFLGTVDAYEMAALPWQGQMFNGHREHQLIANWLRDLVYVKNDLKYVVEYRNIFKKVECVSDLQTTYRDAKVQVTGSIENTLKLVDPVTLAETVVNTRTDDAPSGWLTHRETKGATWGSSTSGSSTSAFIGEASITSSGRVQKNFYAEEEVFYGSEGSSTTSCDGENTVSTGAGEIVVYSRGSKVFSVPYTSSITSDASFNVFDRYEPYEIGTFLIGWYFTDLDPSQTVTGSITGFDFTAEEVYTAGAYEPWPVRPRQFFGAYVRRFYTGEKDELTGDLIYENDILVADRETASGLVVGNYVSTSLDPGRAHYGGVI